VSSFDITELILHKPNFLSKEQCDFLIEFYEKNKKQKTRESCAHAETLIDTESTFDVIDIPFETEANQLICLKVHIKFFSICFFKVLKVRYVVSFVSIFLNFNLILVSHKGVNKNKGSPFFIYISFFSFLTGIKKLIFSL